MERLRTLLSEIDGRPYKAYKRLKGRYEFADFGLSIDHVQGDPFAAPSRLSVQVDLARTGLSDHYLADPVRRNALADWLGRGLDRVIGRVVRGRRGSGKSGDMGIACGPQQVLVRNAVVFSQRSVEARMVMGLPAAGRTILGREAQEMFFRELVEVVARGLADEHLDRASMQRHVHSVEDQEYLRRALPERGLVAFVADGSLLPRASGIDDRPLSDSAIPFRAPDAMAVTIDLPHAGPVRGLGVPEGVTLIVGGGYHGKSTLLHALERGVYNHVPGDGRERVASLPSTVKVRAEDGRSVAAVRIRPFIDRLPLGRDTESFSTENASGSTSQVANIVEALDGGARLLLVDEDTSATNFMIRDQRMQALVADAKEPITPFLHRVRELHRRHGVSSIIVMGGSGDYFAVADKVIMMDTYAPRDVTGEAHALADALAAPGTKAYPDLSGATQRRPDPGGLDPGLGRHEAKIDARDRASLRYGRHEVDLGRVEQLVDRDQTLCIGWIIRHFAAHYAASCADVAAGLEATYRDIEAQGLDLLSPYKVGNLALPRLHETLAAVNRIRGIRWLSRES